jgi:hypothetical protein
MNFNCASAAISSPTMATITFGRTAANLVGLGVRINWSPARPPDFDLVNRQQHRQFTVFSSRWANNRPDLPMADNNTPGITGCPESDLEKLLINRNVLIPLIQWSLSI